MDSLYKLFFKEDRTKNKTIKFNTIALMILILIIINFYFRYNAITVVVLTVFVLWITNFYVLYESENVNDFNKMTLAKLGLLQKEVDNYILYKIKLLEKTGGALGKIDYDKMYETSKLTSLYMDANLINFLYSIRDISKWNNKLYYDLIVGTNNILSILEEIELYNEETGSYQDNIAEMLEGAMELRLRMLNNMHDFIYTIPKGNRTNKYLNEISERYRILITRVTDKIYDYYKDALRQKGINNTTKFVNYFDSPRGFDPSEFNKFY